MQLSGTASRFVAAIGVALAAEAFLPVAAGAETYRVVNVGAGDWLNMRGGPSSSFPVVGTIPRDATDIEKPGPCVGNWCTIVYRGTLGWVNVRYLAVVRETGGSTASPGTPTPAAPGFANTIVSHDVMPDGTLAILLPDGSVRQRLPNGNTVTIRPDGTRSTFQYLNVQSADPPPLPAGHSAWGERLGNSLLGILRNILNENEFNAYMQTEGGKTYYQIVDWRLRSIQFLTLPNS